MFVFRNNISACQNTLGDRLQAPRSTSRSVEKRPATRSQPILLEKRPDDPSVSQLVDLTVDSSCEGSSGPNTLQVVRESTPVEKRPRLQEDLPPVTFADSSFTPQQSTRDKVVSEGFVPSSQHVPPEPHSSYPSLSLPAQPVVDDSEVVRTSSRSKKATKFFVDPLRHSVKVIQD